MSTHLLHLPKELLKNILVLIGRDTAQTAAKPATRSKRPSHNPPSCGTSSVSLAPSVMAGLSVSSSTTLALPDHMAMLQALEEAWNPLGASGKGYFWRKRSPDLRITLPP